MLELSPCVRKAFVAHACWIHDDIVQSQCRETCSLLSPNNSIAVGENGSWRVMKMGIHREVTDVRSVS